MMTKALCYLVSITLIVTSVPIGAAIDDSSGASRPVFGMNLGLRELVETPPTGSSLDLPPLPELEFGEPSLIQARDAAYRVADAYDPADFFLQDLTDRLMFDPEAAFEYVRDRIDLDPYPGRLRGHHGVLGARAGNSLERAMLLQRVLQDMAFDARLVRGRLDAENAAELLRHAVGRRASGPDPAPIASIIGFVPPVLQRMMQRTARDFRWLHTAVADELEAARPSRRGMADLEDHYWVEARLDGQWQAMDTAFPDARIGEAFAEPQTYHADPPTGLAHLLRLRVVGETFNGEQLEQSRLLELELPVPEANLQRIHLAFHAADSSLGGALGQAMGEGRIFKPVVTVDGRSTTGTRAAPLVLDTPDSAAAEFLGAAERPTLSALYLDVDSIAPDGSNESHRRVLFDRVPDAARKSGRLAGVELAPVGRVEDIPEPFAATHQIMVSTGGLNPHRTANGLGLAIHYLAAHLSKPGTLDGIDLDSMMWPLALRRQAMIVANEMLVREAMNDLPGARHFIASPRVYVFSSELRPSRERDFELVSSIDLLADDIAVVAGNDVPASELAASRMWYGVFQSAFETTLLEIPYLPLAQPPVGVVSASNRVGGRAVTADSLLSNISSERIPPALQRAMEVPGTVVLSDAQSGPLDTWWTVAPDGSTRAVLAPGLGGVTDYTWWKNYNNSRFPTKTYHTSLTPEMSRAQQQAYLDGKLKAYNEGGGRAAAQRVKKGPSTPSRLGAPTRTGHTEDTMLRTLIAVALIPVSAVYGLTLVATATVAFLAMFVYVAYLETTGETP
jgi:hypothetical protein